MDIIFYREYLHSKDRKRSNSIILSGVDYEIALMQKEFQKNDYLNQIIANIEIIINSKIEQWHSKISDQLTNMENEIYEIKQKLLLNMQDGLARTGSRGNNSFLDGMDDSFLYDDSKINKKIQSLEETMKRKLTSLDNLLNMVIENQQQYKAQNKTEEPIKLEVLQQCIQLNPNQSQQLKSIKSLIQDYNSLRRSLLRQLLKIKVIIPEIQETHSIQWALINQCKDEQDKLTKYLEEQAKSQNQPLWKKFWAK